MKKLVIVKIGGQVVDDSQKLKSVLSDFSEIKGPKLLVHGGGKKATELAKQLNIPVEMHQGRRITSAQMLDVAVMTYAGLINKNIAAQLQSSGVNAIGLSGADGNLISATKRDVKNGVDFGWVGDVQGVELNLLKTFFDEGLTPVVAPISHDGDGHLLNTNADTIATDIAIAMSEVCQVDLIYCFELIGVMHDLNDPSSLIRKLDPAQFFQMKSSGLIKDGMIPKLENALRTFDVQNVKARIVSSDNLGKVFEDDYEEYTEI